jgi:hypothetical protein
MLKRLFVFLLVCYIWNSGFAQEEAAPGNVREAGGGGKTAVSLIPFWGENKDTIAQFGEVLNQAVGKSEAYRPAPVDMNHLPLDVPEGGFPPYICPSPSMTGEAPYALTGEIIRDAGTNTWHLRLYFWEIASRRLLCSDEMEAADRAQCAIVMPALLDWLFSWTPPPAKAAAPCPPETGEDIPAEPPVTETETAGLPGPESKPPEPEMAEKWLYAGARAGSSFGFYTRTDSQPFLENQTDYYLNLNAAVYGAVQLFSFFAVQPELALFSDFAPFKIASRVPGPGGAADLELHSAPFFSWSLMVPLSAKLTLRRPRYFAALFAGVYLTLPLGRMRNERYGGDFQFTVYPPMGYHAGVNMGIQAGPGLVFLDLRWVSDIGETRKDTGEMLYKRNLVTISAGYELGFFPKR